MLTYRITGNNATGYNVRLANDKTVYGPFDNWEEVHDFLRAKERELDNSPCPSLELKA